MTGDCHVQFCEGLWVKLPRSTLSTPENIQKLQTALHAKAKESPSYRFYRLYDKVYRRDILEFAYLRKSAELAIRAKEPAQALTVLDEARSLARTANERADLERIEKERLVSAERAEADPVRRW